MHFTILSNHYLEFDTENPKQDILAESSDTFNRILDIKKHGKHLKGEGTCKLFHLMLI